MTLTDWTAQITTRKTSRSKLDLISIYVVVTLVLRSITQGQEIDIRTLSRLTNIVSHNEMVLIETVVRLYPQGIQDPVIGCLLIPPKKSQRASRYVVKHNTIQLLS